MGGQFIWERVRDEWLFSHKAQVIFIFSSVVSVVVSTILFVNSDAEPVTFLGKVAFGLSGAVCALTAICICSGMMRFWVKVDQSSTIVHRIWFVAMLIGLWYGAAVYCFLVFLPQAKRRCAGGEGHRC